MKMLCAALLLTLSASPAFAEDTKSNLSGLTAEALGDIRYVVMYNEMVRNHDWLYLNERTYDCSLHEDVLTCAGWYGVYHQNPATPGVEPSFGSFAISFSVNSGNIGAIIDESIEKL